MLCDRNDQNHSGFPTVVFEVGYTESQAALNYNAARLLFGSGGCINTAVTIKLIVEEGEIKYVGVDVWRMTCEVENEVEGIKRDVILTKENKLANPRTLSWFFSFFTTEDATLFHLKAEPLHYQVIHLAVSIRSKILTTS